MCGQVEVFYGSIDASERPVRKARGWPAAMRKLIVTEKVYMDGGQASRDVHLSTDRNDFPQGNADAHTREHHPQLLGEPLTFQKASGSLRQPDYQLKENKSGNAHHCGELQQEEHEDFMDSAGAPCVPETRMRNTKIALLGRGAAGEHIGPRTAALEQAFALGCKLLFEPPGPIRIEQDAHFTLRSVEKAERRNSASDAVIQLALHGRRSAREARIERVEGILAVVPQPLEKWHASSRDRRFNLAAGQAVDLNQEQAGLLARAVAL